MIFAKREKTISESHLLNGFKLKANEKNPVHIQIIVFWLNPFLDLNAVRIWTEKFESDKRIKVSNERSS